VLNSGVRTVTLDLSVVSQACRKLTVRLWIEQESLCLRAIDDHGDPVELTKEEAVKLAEALLNFSKEIDS
jgi:hypothetical protein